MKERPQSSSANLENCFFLVRLLSLRGLVALVKVPQLSGLDLRLPVSKRLPFFANFLNLF